MHQPHPGAPIDAALPDPDTTKLLQHCAEQIRQTATCLEEEIQVTELVVILADLQAGRAESAAACVRRLFPRPDSSALYLGIAAPALRSLQTQAQSASRTAGFYRTRLRQLRQQYSAEQGTHPAQSWQLPHDALHAFDHFAYPLGTLLQTLPGDITNVGSLDHEERQMCESVAALAYQAQETLMDGLAVLGNLLAAAGNRVEAATLAQAGNLTAWLTTQARFMTQNAAEYGAAAMNCRSSRL